MKTIAFSMIFLGGLLMAADAPKEPKPLTETHKGLIDLSKTQVENAKLKMTVVEKEYTLQERRLADLRTEYAKYQAEQKAAQGKLDVVVVELEKTYNAIGYELDLNTYAWKKIEPKKEEKKTK
jgi:hypothetical protein